MHFYVRIYSNRLNVKPSSHCPGVNLGATQQFVPSGPRKFVKPFAHCPCIHVQPLFNLDTRANGDHNHSDAGRTEMNLY